MSCYCTTPDQVTIEERAKVHMYLDACATLTKEQIKHNRICRVPLPDPSTDSNTALCNLCGILTEEQMKRVSAYYYQIKWPHKTLFDWYEQHKIDDEKHNDHPNTAE